MGRYLEYMYTKFVQYILAKRLTALIGSVNIVP